MSLVPARMLFDFEFPLRYRKGPPRLTGRLADWSEDFLLPQLCRLESIEPFAPIYAAWNESGLFLATRVEGKRSALVCDPDHYWKSDNLRLCTDMRDTRNIRRASRHCQQFYLMPRGGGPRGDKPIGGSAKFNLAREHAPAVAPGTIQVAAEVSRDGYGLEAQIPASALAGFDPAEHPRIGFYYILEDRDRGQQYLTVGDELNWHVDPSTWATAVLTR